MLLTGLVVLRSPARLGESVCTLCLPREGQSAEVGEECTVTGYGRPTDTPVRGRGSSYWSDTTTDGVLREAALTIKEDAVCEEYVQQETGAPTNMTSLLCATGKGEEQACYVSTLTSSNQSTPVRLAWTEEVPCLACTPRATTTSPASCPGAAHAAGAPLQGVYQ